MSVSAALGAVRSAGMEAPASADPPPTSRTHLGEDLLPSASIARTTSARDVRYSRNSSGTVGLVADAGRSTRSKLWVLTGYDDLVRADVDPTGCVPGDKSTTTASSSTRAPPSPRTASAT
jgi:hypothetical protein